jgi:hypothetical protein
MSFTRRQATWCWTALLAGGVILGAGGCSKGPEEKLARVTGKLTVDGQPLKAGSITFRPDSGRGNKSQHQPTSAISPEGTYDLFVPVDRKGAPSGWYKVVVTAYDNPRPGHLKSFISMRYQDEKTTPLAVEVIENPEPGRYDFSLKR